MQPLPYPDVFYVQAAEGWLLLGDSISADQELQSVALINRSHPSVLAVRWSISAVACRWAEGWAVSKLLTEVLPNSPAMWLCHANSVRNFLGIEASLLLLKNIAQRFPAEPLIPYNLACHEALLGHFDASCAWLRKACLLGDKRKITKTALADPDLQALWERPEACSLVGVAKKD